MAVAASVVLGWIEIPVPAQSVKRGSSKTQPANETEPATRTYRPRLAEIFRATIRDTPQGLHREGISGEEKTYRESQHRTTVATTRRTRPALLSLRPRSVTCVGGGTNPNQP